jgi:predicted nucleic acid-binding protein
MIGLDSNILVQLAVAEHEKNVATTRLFKGETERGGHFAIASLVITEFLHIATDARRFNPPLTQIEALDWAGGFLTLPEVSLLESNRESTHLTLHWMRQFQLGRKRILDTHLAAILHVSGVRRLITSNPSDFAVFGVFELMTP